jgi:hypothetical protein
MDEQEREAFADLIRKNGYPQAQLIPPERDGASLIDILYSDMTGWQYKFTLPADALAFSNFVRTGVFEFKIGEFLIRTEFTPGLENAPRFQRACRASTSR